MKKLGPGFLIAAAFIGPGTVATCITAGVSFGFSLIWAVLFSIVATIFLQEMAVRLGIITQKGLVRSIQIVLRNNWLRIAITGIVLMAIILGNVAYEAGNIGGAALGLEAIFGKTHSTLYPYIIGLVAFLLLWVGSYGFLEKVFMILIAFMSLSFVAAAVLTKPDMIVLLKSIVFPKIPKGSLLNIIALVGTTIVPYNLFLHVSLVNEKWKSKENLKTARWDTLLSIGLGGMVSVAIVIAAAAVSSNGVTGVLDLVKALEPLFGGASRYFLGIGLFAAGITSSITAPLAAALVARNCFGWELDMKNWKFRLVWLGVLAFGVFSLSFGHNPIQIIQFAQVANGILLPVMAFLLVWITSSKLVMGRYHNKLPIKIIGSIIVVLSLILGIKSIAKVWVTFGL